jgi:nucleoside-diphosphate-sugar epimerase
MIVMRKVLVTGASGFLGSHICEAAHEAGYEVHAIIRKTSSREWLNHDWITIHVAELDDPDSLLTILKGTYAVIHAAAALHGSSEEELSKVNVEASKMLAQQAVKAGVKRFIFISSNAVGGPSKTLTPRKESDPDFSISPYGRSKKRAEEELSKFSNEIKIINLRCVVIYGPRDRHMLRLFKLFNSPLVPVLGSKPIYLPIVYVKDAARAAIAALQADVASGSIYYISDGMPYTFEVFYDFIAHAFGKKLRIFRVPIWLASLVMWLIYGARKKEVAFSAREMRGFRHRFRLVSIERAVKELRWRPQFWAEDGLSETVRWYKDKGWLPRTRNTPFTP